MRKMTMSMTCAVMAWLLLTGVEIARTQDRAGSAVLEARIVRDSAGCPSAVDIWLVSTTDTIQGFEAVLQWDRPDGLHFVQGLPGIEVKHAAKDSLTNMLKPTDPRTQIPTSKEGTILSAWEFVEARSADGHSAKVLGVAKLFGQDDPAPILPGSSGTLLRLPIRASKPETMKDTTLTTLSFDPAGTRLSTHRGVLFGGLTLNPLKTQPACMGKKP